MTIRTLDDLVDGFALFDSWEDRYRYLIDLGQRLRPMEAALKTEDRLVRGCTSRVWLDVALRAAPDGGKTLHFEADSDAQIVKGLIYILAVAYQNKTPQEVIDLDIGRAFDRLGLSGHLSPSRRNGFFAMVEHLRSRCAAESPR